MPPSVPSTPGNTLLVQCISSPARQYRHNPQMMWGCKITASPVARFETADPTSSTQPAFSWPRVNGSGDASAAPTGPRRCAGRYGIDPPHQFVPTHRGDPSPWALGPHPRMDVRGICEAVPPSLTLASFWAVVLVHSRWSKPTMHVGFDRSAQVATYADRTQPVQSSRCTVCS